MTIGDPRFFARSGPHPLRRVAEAAAGAAPPEADLLLAGVAPLHAAGPQEVGFLDNRRYAAALEAAAAGAVVVHPDMLARVPPGTVPIVTAEPYAGWARVAALFHPEPPVRPGVHPTAAIAEGVRVDATAEVGPFALVEAGAEVGARCRIGAHASLSHAIVGARVHVHPGARIGQEGFGFAAAAAGFLSVPHLGRVVLGDDVEVGANTTIDRGSTGDTVVGAGSRLDNLVQVGHNVRLGRCCVVVAQVGIAGSTVLEDFVQVGGQAAIAGHIRIGHGARIGAQAGVMSDVPPGAALVGSPAQPRQEFFRQVATLKRMAARQRG